MKRILAFTLALVLALTLAACGGNNNSGNNGNNNTPSSNPTSNPTNSPSENQSSSPTESPLGASDSSGLDGYGQSYIDAHLGNNYSLTFKYDKTANGKTAASTQTFIVTEEGYYQHSEGVNFEGEDTFFERWYIKNADGEYDQYYRVSTGDIREDSKATSDELLGDYGTFTDMFSYMSAYEGSGMAQFFTKAGDATLADRDCVKLLYGGQFEYLIDKETGVCLKYSSDVLGTTIEYEVTEFQVGGASLPDHK